MSTTAYYNFIASKRRQNATNANDHGSSHNITCQIDLRGQPPSSFLSSSQQSNSTSTSSSSLNQYNSLTNSVNEQQTQHATSVSSSNSSTCSSSSPNNLADRQSQRRHSSLVRPERQQAGISQHRHQMVHSYTLHSLEPKPFKPFKSSGEYLEAMKEDLAEWFNELYEDLNLDAENFFGSLENGSIICRHANRLTQMGRESMRQLHASSSTSQNQDSSISSSDSGLNTSTESAINNNLLPPNTTTPTQTVLNSPASPSSSDCSLMATNAAKRSINWFNIKMLPFKEQAKAGTFFARDNICQFILWCRSLNILECLLFETDDLVARKNERSVILCLLEVARIGFKVGMPTPLIIQLEQEIDREIEKEAQLERRQKEAAEAEEARRRLAKADERIDNFQDDEEEDDLGVCGGIDLFLSDPTSEQARQQEEPSIEYLKLEGDKREEEEDGEVEEEDTGPKPQVITNDLLSLHERVVQLLCQCTCPTQFPMVRVGDNGKYKVGDKLIIFVRILRSHIMVRVGGGWQELEQFLRAHDPCRSRKAHPHSPEFLHLHQQNHNHHHTHDKYKQGNLINQLKLKQFQTKIASNSFISHIPTASKVVSKSRLVESSQHLDQKGHLMQQPHFRSGRKLISSSASMSWLSQN